MPHLVLLGDSVIDNAAYVGSAPCVRDQVRRALPAWAVTQRAVDGHLVRDVRGQLNGLPTDASHLFVSAGGNDALSKIDLLRSPAATVGDAMLQLGGAAEAFEKSYRAMIAAITSRRLPLTVCTIYRPRFDDETVQYIASTALTHFNDVILRVAFEHRLAVLDLRLVSTEPDDYANEIEPSSKGGEKIARAMARVLTEHSFERGVSSVYGSAD
jgi:lysophospholipase L1-like esterase